MLTPFLRQVAQYYRQKGNVHDYCFVFPNHRSSKFFERELEMVSNGSFLMPQVMTITELVTSLSGLVAVTPVDAVFELYKCYTSIEGNEQYPFDKFVYWGNVVLNDFNDVDMYLVDPKQIFTNVRDYGEIQSSYIDEELRDIMKRYFALNIKGETTQDDNFWIQNYDSTGTSEDSVKGEYLRLWQSMLELYDSYNDALRQRGLSTMGHIYRQAVEAVSCENSVDLGHRHLVFVGFNMLSTSEIVIFKQLSKSGLAQFFWDVASPAFDDKFPENRGGRLVKFYQKEFPEPADFVSQPVKSFPAIEEVGVPSNVGQAKYAFHLVDNLLRRNEINHSTLKMDDGTEHHSIADASEVAIVLPDESLFVPLLNSISPGLDDINVTMGYPLNGSDIASLMRVVANLHNRARRDADGRWTFYREDVKVLLSHPIIKSCYGRDAIEVIRAMSEKNQFMVPMAIVQETGFATLFHTFEQSQGSKGVIDFLSRLVKFCTEVAELMATKRDSDDSLPAGDDEGDSLAPRGMMTLQEAFINQYIEVLNRMIECINRHDVPQCENTIFYLIDRLAALYTIPLEGEPLHGLQVMGLLETRCLDFKNIIITSANERVLPRKFRSSTFISDFMRRSFGMSTTAHQEAMWTYYFYRLIGRASNVFLLYDTSAQAMGSGEHSRFVEQLEKVYGCKVHHTTLNMELPPSKGLNISVPKLGHVLDEVNGYKTGNRMLSASSIKEYVDCPLMFYFHHIEHLSADNDEVDFMDASTFGTIAHETLQELFYPDVDGQSRSGDYRVTCAMIEDFEKNKLDTVVRHKVNEQYVHCDDLDAPLAGEASIVSVAVKMFVKNALRYDKELLSNIGSNAFTVLECEREHQCKIRFGNEEFNFRYIADRIDRLPCGTLRMVDYKSGSDKTGFNGISSLFEGEEKNKAVLQLMLYCNAYAQETGCDEPIMPMIYTLRDMSIAGVLLGKNKEQLDDYHSINEEFAGRMAQVMKGFFDTQAPFVQTGDNNPSTSPCRYCKFVDFCRR